EERPHMINKSPQPAPGQSTKSRKGRKRLIRPAAAMAGITLAGLLAAGCASGSSGGNGGSSSGPTTLTVWSFQGESTNPTAGVPYAFHLIDQAFEKAHPNIK